MLLRLAALRLALSRAKHRSLAGHARMARRIAALMPFYEYDEASSSRRRCAGRDRRAAARRIFRLATCTAQRFAQDRSADRRDPGRGLRPAVHRRATGCRSSSAAWCASTCAGAFLQSSSGVTVTDLDGNRFYDLTGSYGVNVFGYDFYKDCIARGSRAGARARAGARRLSPGHRLQRARLREISGLDEVSFHMSGTEAVMQAVRLARYHTRRSHLVRFCGAYHGWWGDVQPGVGNPLAGARDLHAQGHVRAHAAGAAQTRATSPACWSIRCRRCIRTPARPAIRAGRQRARAAFRRAPPTPRGCSSCARSAPSAASC
jgi:glutamate-1-semialdehyde 2,1-aminomutase